MKKLLILFFAVVIIPNVFSQNLNLVNTTDNGNLFGNYNARYGVFSGTNLSGNSISFNTGNSFFGYASGTGTNGSLASEGNYNSIVGYFAGYRNTLGSNNTFLGSQTGNNNKTAIFLRLVYFLFMLTTLYLSSCLSTTSQAFCEGMSS